MCLFSEGVDQIIYWIQAKKEKNTELFRISNYELIAFIVGEISMTEFNLL